MQARLTLVVFALTGLLLAPARLAPAQAPEAAPATPAALPIDRGAAALWQSLQKLNTRASIMMIDAHPDDEDGGMLTYESRGQGARTALLALNRGEGGQNAMSGDAWDRLGLLRTQELIAAGRYYGLDELYFTRVADFGFSKTREEALSLWGHDRVLYDVVRAVRLSRPLVVASVFVGGITDGHGQHQVSGEMAQEVFRAAGDPSVFPDQIRAGLLPWSPLKVYARVPSFSISPQGMYDYATGKWAPVRFYDYVSQQWSQSVPATNLNLPEGNYDPLLGLGYFQIARQGLGRQKSQNGGAGRPLGGAFTVPYHRYGSKVPAGSEESSFFDGIDTSVAGIATLAPGAPPFLSRDLAAIAASIRQAVASFSAAQPGRCAPPLAAGMQQTQSLIQAVESSSLSAAEKYNLLHELRIKQAQFNNALLQALGIQLTAVVAPSGTARQPPAFVRGAAEPQDTFTVAVPGQSFSVLVYLNNPSPLPVRIEDLSLRANPSGSGGSKWSISTVSPVSGELSGDRRLSASFQVAVPQDAPPTKPYFHRDSIEQPYYDIDGPKYLNLPSAPYPLEASLTVGYLGVTLHAARTVDTVQHVTGRGAVYEPLVVAPAISLLAEGSAGVIPLEQGSATVAFRLHSNIQGPAQGEVHLRLPPGWSSTPSSASFATAKAGEEQDFNFSIQAKALAAKSYSISAVAGYRGREYGSGYVTVGYPGLQPTNYYPSSPYRLTGVDLKIAPDLNVGYIMGTGDDVPQSLSGLGVRVHLLSDDEVARADLSRYDVLVLGIRAYAARPALAACNQRLIEYAQRGGVVVVQYGLREFDHNYGPYPYSVTSDPEKVVDERAPVDLLDPSNPILSWPNRITPADFDGWIEERGHGFLTSWDSHYEPLTETHDPNQDPQKGGLLYARYGSGAYVYVAFALYRQLQEGVPGAYRLFANLISLPKAPHPN